MVTLDHKNIFTLEKRGKVHNWSQENSPKFPGESTWHWQWKPYWKVNIPKKLNLVLGTRGQITPGSWVIP